MPQERGYERQSGTPQPVALPQAGAGAFGAGVGGAIAQAGEAVHGAQLRAYQLDRQQRAGQESAAAAVRMAEARLSLDQAAINARQSGPRDGAGHYDAMEKAADATLSTITDGITDEAVRRQVGSQAQAYRASFLSGEYAWQVGTAAKAGAQDVGLLGDMASARIDNSPDANAYLQETLAFDDALNARADISEEMKQALRREYHARFAVTHATRVIRENPSAAIDMIDKGAFNDVLDAKQLQGLRENADLETRRRDNAAKREATLALAQVKEREAQALQFVGDGGEVDPARLDLLAQGAYARGDQTTGDKLKAAAVGARIAIPFAGAGAQQLTDAMATIERDAKWRSDPAKVYAHNWLERRRSDQRSADPAIAAPSWNDADSVAAFEAQVRADAQVRHAEPRYLTRDMEATLKPMLGTLQGRQEVLGMLGRMSAGARASAVRQLAPEDAAFQGAANMTPRVREMILSGQEVLKAKTVPASSAKSGQVYATYAAPALKALQGDVAAQVQAMATAITADLMSRRGMDHWTEEVAREGLHLALGGSGSRGGLGYWRNGDGRAARFVLPGNMTQGEFDAHLARKSGPLGGFINGRRITAAELRAHFTPVTVGSDLYEWEDANGRALKDSRGNDWRTWIGQR